MLVLMLNPCQLIAQHSAGVPRFTKERANYPGVDATSMIRCAPGERAYPKGPRSPMPIRISSTPKAMTMTGAKAFEISTTSARLGVSGW